MIKNANGTTLNLDRVTNELLQNELLTRSKLFANILDERRDIDDECGYPDTGRMTADTFQRLFDREPVATRVVDVLPKESWSVLPELIEDDDIDNQTPFEEAFDELGKGLRGESWFESPKTNPLWEYLLRADILSGIGHYGVVLLGTDDGLELSEPAEGVSEENSMDVADANSLNTSRHPEYKITTNASKGRKLLFIRTYPEQLAEIKSTELNRTSPRFGQPTSYSLSTIDATTSHLGKQVNVDTVTVHWTRVIHLVDTNYNASSSEVFGVPRMRPVYNRLYDLRKLYGGSGEMYWRGAFPGYSLETDPSLGGDVEIDDDTVKDAIEQYTNGLQRFLALKGMTVKSLAPQVVDPTPQINTQLEAICILLGIPKRIFMGSERGELSSGQDKDTWGERMASRRTSYIAPRIVVPTIDRLIMLGVLPEPESYKVTFPEELAEDPLIKAQVLKTNTEAIAAYIAGGVNELITEPDYLTRFVGLDEDETDEILKAAEEQQDEADDEEPLPVPPVAALPAPPAAQLPAGPPAPAIPVPSQNLDLELTQIQNEFGLSDDEIAEVEAEFVGEEKPWVKHGGGLPEVPE